MLTNGVAAHFRTASAHAVLIKINPASFRRDLHPEAWKSLIPQKCISLARLEGIDVAFRYVSARHMIASSDFSNHRSGNLREHQWNSGDVPTLLIGCEAIVPKARAHNS